MKLPLIEIKPRKKGRVLTGANTVLTINGKELVGATSFKFEVSAKKVAKATITLVGDIRIKGRPLVSYVEAKRK